MEIKDLAGLSQPLTKLIEVVSGGIGTLYKPRQMRKEADADAYRLEVLAIAEAKKSLIQEDTKIELAERAKQRLYLQELTRQENIEEIAEKAIEYLPEEVSVEPLDDDWRARFFNKAQDVGNEEMQRIWGQILASEVAKPGTISYRTLDIVANLSKEEAKLFEVACSLLSNRRTIFKLSSAEGFENFGLRFFNLLMLIDAGLIQPDNSLVFELKMVLTIDEAPGSLVVLGQDPYVIYYRENPNLASFSFEHLSLTQAGFELGGIIEMEINQDYIKKLKKEIEFQGYKLELALEIDESRVEMDSSIDMTSFD